MAEWKVVTGDCLSVMKALPDNSFDSMCTDPPAGIGFMNLEFDSDKGGRDQWIAWLEEVMREAARLLKPGAHAFVWAIPRTSHWTATAIENSGLEIREICHALHGQGFPKSQDVGKFIDKMAGAERTEGAREWRGGQRSSGILGENLGTQTLVKYDTPVTEAAKTWDGWGTAMKPSVEHWILCRKPLSESSIARNVLKWRTGALNIDACRVNRASDDVPGWHKTGAAGSKGYQGEDTFRIRDMSAEEIQERCGDKGRWPPNLLLTCSCDEPHDDPTCPVAEMDRQSGTRKSPPMQAAKDGVAQPLAVAGGWNTHSMTRGGQHAPVGYGDSGGASRFFPTFKYQAKPSSSERNAGLDEHPDRTLNRVNPGGIENDPRWAPVQVKNSHPTLKSIALMKWLCSLITPVGGYILDPFLGSGSTGCAAVQLGFGFYGCDKDPEYVAIAESRIRYWEAKAQATEE